MRMLGILLALFMVTGCSKHYETVVEPIITHCDRTCYDCDGGGRPRIYHSGVKPSCLPDALDTVHDKVCWRTPDLAGKGNMTCFYDCDPAADCVAP